MTKITIDRALVEQALEALESGLLIPHSAEVFANLRAALAEPKGGGNLPPPLQPPAAPSSALRQR